MIRALERLMQRRAVKAEREPYGVEIIGRCQYVDTDSVYGTEYLVDVATLRVNPTAVNEYNASAPLGGVDPYDDDTDVIAIRTEARKRCERMIVEAAGLGWQDNFHLSQLCAEFFSVLHFTRIEKEEHHGEPV